MTVTRGRSRPPAARTTCAPRAAAPGGDKVIDGGDKVDDGVGNNKWLRVGNGRGFNRRDAKEAVFVPQAAVKKTPGMPAVRRRGGRTRPREEAGRPDCGAEGERRGGGTCRAGGVGWSHRRRGVAGPRRLPAGLPGQGSAPEGQPLRPCRRRAGTPRSAAVRAGERAGRGTQTEAQTGPQGPPCRAGLEAAVKRRKVKGARPEASSLLKSGPLQ